jgi:hypothetical protein
MAMAGHGGAYRYRPPFFEDRAEAAVVSLAKSEGGWPVPVTDSKAAVKAVI